MQVFEKETFILEKLGHAVASVLKKIYQTLLGKLIFKFTLGNYTTYSKDNFNYMEVCYLDAMAKIFML